MNFSYVNHVANRGHHHHDNVGTILLRTMEEEKNERTSKNCLQEKQGTFMEWILFSKKENKTTNALKCTWLYSAMKKSLIL